MKIVTMSIGLVLVAGVITTIGIANAVSDLMTKPMPDGLVCVWGDVQIKIEWSPMNWIVKPDAINADRLCESIRWSLETK